MESKQYQICSNCIMDNSDSEISFDQNLVCDHCRTFKEKIEPNWKAKLLDRKYLNDLIKDIKKKSRNKEYDCIIGMSGGIDSSYLVYLAVEEMGLNPLVFHVDAGWNSQIAVNNIEKIIDNLKLDLFTEVINWKEMRDLQLSFFKSGVPHIDAPQDHAFFATMYKFASKYNIKYILTGGNYSTECIRNPKEWMYYQSDLKQLKDIQSKYGSVKLKTFPTTSILWHKVWLPYVKKIKLVRPLDYFIYDKKKAMDLLSKKFSWQPYPQKHFESRFTKFYESYWLPKRFGYDVRKVQLSSLILTKQITRKEALEEIKKSPYNEEEINNEIQFVANKLEISVKELNSYLELPKRTYKDFDNQDIIYKFGNKVLNYLNIENGGKR